MSFRCPNCQQIDVLDAADCEYCKLQSNLTKAEKALKDIIVNANGLDYDYDRYNGLLTHKAIQSGYNNGKIYQAKIASNYFAEKEEAKK